MQKRFIVDYDFENKIYCCKKSCKNENDFKNFSLLPRLCIYFSVENKFFLYCAVALSLTRFSFELSLKTSAQDFL